MSWKINLRVSLGHVIVEVTYNTGIKETFRYKKSESGHFIRAYGGGAIPNHMFFMCLNALLAEGHIVYLNGKRYIRK